MQGPGPGTPSLYPAHQRLFLRLVALPSIRRCRYPRWLGPTLTGLLRAASYPGYIHSLLAGLPLPLHQLLHQEQVWGLGADDVQPGEDGGG